MRNRTMRLIVLFDLPTQTKQERKVYSTFRKFLVKHGFMMLQYSVYVRITRNHDDCQKYISLIETNRPERGDIRCLQVTERQYESIKLITGSNESKQEYKDDEMLEI